MITERRTSVESNLKVQLLKLDIIQLPQHLLLLLVCIPVDPMLDIGLVFRLFGVVYCKYFHEVVAGIFIEIAALSQLEIDGAITARALIHDVAIRE